MTHFDEREAYKLPPPPPPFPLDARMIAANLELSLAQQKAIAILELQHAKKCALEYINFIEEFIKILEI